MTRLLPDHPNLGFLKREAKQILKTKKSEGDHRATLHDVQLALARDYGFSGWAELKAFVESQTPVLSNPRVVLKVTNYEKAVAHYVEWLGFNLDWDWREAPGQPAIVALSRDGVQFFLSEAPETRGPTSLHINVDNFEALIDEWNHKRPNSVKARIEPPYEFPDVSIEDPFGNILVFEGQNQKKEQQRYEAIRPKMRAYVEEALAAGLDFPTPEEIREVVGPPLGVAIEVLNEFEGYGAAFNARQSEEGDQS
ncbi:MAG: glyoxalase superfamily protein [Pseudomonadota bacterium]